MKVQNLKLKTQNLILVILAVVIIFIAVNIFLRWWNRDVVPVKTARVTRGTIEALVSASGFVDAPVYELGTKMGGKVADWKVKEGDRIRQGQTLGEFDDTTRIVSPSNGLVGKINFLEGETVIPGSPAIVIVNYERSWVEAQIDEIDIAGVMVGDMVNITSDVYPDKVFPGEIYWIAPLAELRRVGGRVKMDEESYVFPSKIRFLGRHDELKVNMSVNVDITSDKIENALIVPREALISRDDSSYVFVVGKNSRVKETKISIGIRSYTSLEALSGINEGETVAISNISKLKNKGRVKIER